MPRIKILGVPVDCLTPHDAILQIAQYFRMPGQFHVTTPNPEMIVETQKNIAFKDVLNQTALNLPDGIGLVWALKRSIKKYKTTNTPPSIHSDQLPHISSPKNPDANDVWRGAGGEGKQQTTNITRITGIDTLTALCSPSSRICPPERIFLLGAAPGIAEKAAEELKRRNPAIREIGTYAGSPRPDDEEEIMKRINAFSPTLLFVAYGAPVQDLWIARNMKKMPTVKVAMGIGGALDFIAGKQRRAPAWMRKIGIEWLWRLIRDPRRIKRIWNAVVVFPCMVTLRPKF